MAQGANGNGNPADELRDFVMPGGRPINWGPPSGMSPLDQQLLSGYSRMAENNRAQEMLSAQVGQMVNAGNPTRVIGSEVRARQSNELNETNAPEYVEGAGNRDTVSDVAKRLKAGSTFSGTSEQYIREQLTRITTQGQGRINPTQAGSILERSVDQSNYPKMRQLGTWLSAAQWLGGDPNDDEVDIGGGRYVSNSRIAEATNEVLSGEGAREGEELSRLGDVRARLEQADTQYRRSAYELQQLQTMSQNGDPRATRLLPQVQARVTERRAMLDMIRAEIPKDDRNTVTPVR